MVGPDLYEGNIALLALGGAVGTAGIEVAALRQLLGVGRQAGDGGQAIHVLGQAGPVAML